MSISLKSEVAELRALLEKLEIKLAEETKAREIAEQKAAALMVEYRRLALRIFGRKSEKLSSDDLRQLLLALGASEEQASHEDAAIPVPSCEVQEEPPEAETKAPKKRRKRIRSTVISDSVERHVTPVKVPESERACSQCGREMTPFGCVAHRRLEFVPAKFVLHIEEREKLSCKFSDCRGDAMTAEREQIPDSPLRVGVSVLAELIESKCDDALPIYRQCDRFRRYGVDFPEATAYGYWDYGTAMMVPLAEALLGYIMEDPSWVGVDDTRIEVLDPSRKGGKYRGHLWCFCASSGLVAFQFTETWEAKEIVEWMSLVGEDTYVQVDDYKGYSSVVDVGGLKRCVVPVERRLGCMMHVRRRFYEALELGDNRAAPAVAWIKQIYKVEESVRGEPPQERLAARKEFSLPVLQEFEAWCDEMQPKLGMTGKLAKAVRYAKHQREYVRRCFEDGRLEIDNGAVERAIREPAIGRKNYLFTGSANGGRRLAAAYTLVMSCRNLGIVVREYLMDVLTKLEAGWPARRLTELLPHRWKELRAGELATAPPDTG